MGSWCLRGPLDHIIDTSFVECHPLGNLWQSGPIGYMHGIGLWAFPQSHIAFNSSCHFHPVPIGGCFCSRQMWHCCRSLAPCGCPFSLQSVQHISPSLVQLLIPFMDLNSILYSMSFWSARTFLLGSSLLSTLLPSSEDSSLLEEDKDLLFFFFFFFVVFPSLSKFMARS